MPLTTFPQLSTKNRIESSYKGNFKRYLNWNEKVTVERSWILDNYWLNKDYTSKKKCSHDVIILQQCPCLRHKINLLNSLCRSVHLRCHLHLLLSQPYMDTCNNIRLHYVSTFKIITIINNYSLRWSWIVAEYSPRLKRIIVLAYANSVTTQHIQEK